MDEITKERDAAVSEYEGMRKRRLTEFMAGFSVISSKLKEMYQVRWEYLLAFGLEDTVDN